MKIWIRLGDQSDYHGFDGIHEAAAYLAEHGVHGWFEKCCPCGYQSPGYEQKNYISLYWGEKAEIPTRELTLAELGELEVLVDTARGEFDTEDDE